MKAKKQKIPKIRELKLGPLWEERNQEFYLRLQKLARSTEPADRELMEAKFVACMGQGRAANFLV